MVMILKLKKSDTFIGIEKSARKGSRRSKREAGRCCLRANVRVKLSLDKQDKEILNQLADAGYTVRYRFYRSTKKAAGYKAAVTKKTMTYTNTTGKQGTKYFYKVQIRVYDKNGKLAAKTALKQCRYACRNWTK